MRSWDPAHSRRRCVDGLVLRESSSFRCDVEKEREANEKKDDGHEDDHIPIIDIRPPLRLQGKADAVGILDLDSAR